jgi:ribosomal protein RSM22 (predicted rRNA methylase)
MNIPEYIADIIKEKLTPSEHTMLAQASEHLSERYRGGNYNNHALTPLERYAYVLARMPATLAALNAVLALLKEENPDFMPSSLLDIGAGPGTASWAASTFFESIREISLVEKDSSWIALGKELAAYNATLAKSSWLHHDLNHKFIHKNTDLIIASYAFQELNSERQKSLIIELFEYSNILIIIEPGTPLGFKNILSLRQTLIEKGAFIIAPCTHNLACPLAPHDWCHSSTRLKRHELHRRTKSASLSYEDEKYAYLIISKKALSSPQARIIRQPLQRSGHVILDLCHEGKERRTIVTRSQKLNYAHAKKLRWGDQCDF